MRKMRIIVAGGREFEDRALLFRTLDIEFGKIIDHITIISGRARGADRLGEEWAASKGLTVENGGLELYPVTDEEWRTLGPKAGILRNHKMGDVATHAVLFHDGKSRGTADMRDYALQKGLWVKVVRYA